MNIFDSIGISTDIAVVILFVIVILQFIWIITIISKCNKLTKRLNKFTSGRDAANFEQVLVKRFSEMKQVVKNEKKQNKNEKKSLSQKVPNKISLWKDNKIYIVNIDDIYYCEAKERYTYIYTKDGEYHIRECISEVEKIINNENFFKCHRSYLVNLLKIEEVVPWFNNTYLLKLNSEKYEITVSRSKVKNFRELMNI